MYFQSPLGIGIILGSSEFAIRAIIIMIWKIAARSIKFGGDLSKGRFYINRLETLYGKVSIMTRELRWNVYRISLLLLQSNYKSITQKRRCCQFSLVCWRATKREKLCSAERVLYSKNRIEAQSKVSKIWKLCVSNRAVKISQIFRNIE